MNKKVVVELQWYLESQGGRKAVPPGPLFSTPARFEGQEPPYPKTAWSLVLRFIEPPAEPDRTHRAEASFLVDEAPQQLLEIGRTFELMEGMRPVARGRVLEPVS